MGMFDTVNFDCPWCSNKLEVQSKGGDCCMDTYPAASVPVQIALDIQNEKLYCQKCDNYFKICTEDPIVTHVEMFLEDDTNEV